MVYILLYSIYIIYPIFKSIFTKKRIHYNYSLAIIKIVYSSASIKLIITVFYLLAF